MVGLRGRRKLPVEREESLDADAAVCKALLNCINTDT